MRLNHMYQGAALWQIANDERFTAINRVALISPDGVESHKGLVVETEDGEEVGVYFKYATEPTSDPNDYSFTFNRDAKNHLEELNRGRDKTFILLVCVEDSEVCCLPYSDFRDMLGRRITARGEDEEVTTLLANLGRGRGFHVNMNMPGRRGYYLGGQIEIPRADFPRKIFE